MIISASRRTDIPSHYSQWFLNRIKEGFVLVRNPMNFHLISKISLSPDVVDSIVFWTKNPAPMLDKLNEFRDYSYYFQFTITAYGKDIEPNLPPKDDAISTFKRLSDMIGADRVIWRYDPILINEKYSVDYHIRAFEKIATALIGYTQKVTISFIDPNYRGVKRNATALSLMAFPSETQTELGARLAQISHSNGLTIDTCAEEIDLSRFGIEHARCIDDRLLAKLLNTQLNVGKDKTQRLNCGCAASIDIGMYNTCLHRCRYCYANYNHSAVNGNFAQHDPLSPLISGTIGEGDKISERAAKSHRDTQIRLIDDAPSDAGLRADCLVKPRTRDLP